MPEIEDLLKTHVGTVEEALGEFKGQIGTLNEAVKALTARADQTEAKANRLSLNGIGDIDPYAFADVKALKIPDDERKYLSAVLKGAPLPELASKSTTMRVASDPEGGILVPEITSTQIEALIRKQSPMRQVARITPLSSGAVLMPINKNNAAAGWVGEGDERTATDTPTISAMRPSGGTLYALPIATEEVIDDAIINLEQLIQESVVDAMAEQESQAFVTGDGVKKPHGFIGERRAERAPTSTADTTRPLGVLQYIPTGHASTLGSDPIAALVSMIFSMKAGYRQAPGCAWLAATDMIASLAKLKTVDGAPIFLPSLREGTPGMLLGYPVIECEHMPAVGADAFPIAFGNWQRGYVIGDRIGLNILRDPYTRKGSILWYFRKRVYGEVVNSEAIKLLKVAAA